MKTYTVRLPYVGYSAIVVEAEDETDAIEKALESGKAELQDGQVVRCLSQATFITPEVEEY